MIASFNRRSCHYLLLVVVSFLMFFLNLGDAFLWDVDEGRNAVCAMEMLASGNWIVPTFNGNLRVDKPVLLYWLQMLAYKCFGINELAARLPSAVAALITVLCGYELGRSMFSRTTGLLTGIIVATTPMLCAAGRFANPDALLNCFAALALTIFWIGLNARRGGWFVLLGGACGLAALAKGPVGLVLPGAVGALFLLWNRQWHIAWDRRWATALLTFALVALPWYLWVGAETKGAFLSGFFVKHNFERGVSVMDAHPGFPGFYLAVLIVGTSPWSLFLGLSWWFGFWSAIRTPIGTESHTSATGCQNPSQAFPARLANRLLTSESIVDDGPTAYRLLFSWIIVYVVFFSIAATKLPNYVLPAVLPCVILIARYLERWQSQALHVPDWIGRAQVITLIVGGATLAIGLAALGGVGEWSVLRNRFIPGMERWAFMGLIPISLGAAGWWFIRSKKRVGFTVALSLGTLLMFASFLAYGVALFNGGKAPQSLVEQAGVYRPEEDIRVGSLKTNHLASLNFYVKRQVHELENEHAAAEFLDADLPVYLILPSNIWQRLAGSLNRPVRVVGQHYDFYQNAEVVVVSNR